MRKQHQKQEQNQMMIPQKDEANFQKNTNQHHKPFLFSALHKTVPIGYQLHQVEVPDFSPPSLATLRQQLPPPQSPTVFLRSKINEEQLQQYLSFVENYYQQKIPDYFAQGSVSRDRARTKAMEFLHEMKYNYVQAKFFIMFPYYRTYNHYRCHKPLNLGDDEMGRRIAEHLEGLKSTKQKQLERWIGTVQNSIESRIHLNKLNTLIEVAKQNKFQIPEAIREHVQRSIKTGREIKKALHSTKLPLDKLLVKRQSLQECKIITNQMIQFEETVGRCEEWIRKQKSFEETYFIFDPEPQLVQIDEKIEFRTLQLLVNQFNNLPLIYQPFEQTTGTLYNSTMILLDKLPPLTKTAKTRTAHQSTSGGIKISIESIREYMKEIQLSPIDHEDFGNFQSSVQEHLEWLQRIGLWLEDQKSQKSLKILNQYSKIINDIPIANKIQYKLQSRLEYYQIMEKVKKDISNPAKYEQIKDAIKKLKEKGYETCEYAKIETRIISYMGWYESQQLLNEDRLPTTNIDLLLRQKYIMSRMIKIDAFISQLESARQQLNIPEEVWLQSQGKVKNIQGLQQKINKIVCQEENNINEVIDALKACIKNGLIFPEFQSLYDQVISNFHILGELSFLLLSNAQLLPDGQSYFFSSQNIEVIMSVLYQHREHWELKQLQTQQAGKQILQKTKQKGFPRHLAEYHKYLKFMQKSEVWNEKVLTLINNFKEQTGEVNIKELMEESKSCLRSRGIDEELNKIDVVVRWRQKISRKLTDNRQSPFDDDDHNFILKLEKDLCLIESIQETAQKMKYRALDYLYQNGKDITAIIEKISRIQIEGTYKLSEMNKFLKEIDREIEKYKLEDKMILSLREQLQQQLLLSDEWKQRYLAVKRFEKKKMRKEDDDIKEVDIEIQLEDPQKTTQNVTAQGILLVQYLPQLLNSPCQIKKKYFIKNGQFCWYFKLLLLVIEFYNGFHLKFAIQDQVRLKTLLSDVAKFIAHYNYLIDKVQKTDHDFSILEAEGAKLPIFFRQTFVLSRKTSYINIWKELADSVLKACPVLNMELKARKPEELLVLLELKKHEKDDGKEEGRGQETGNKRKRKQNTFYSNEDMTLITEDTFGLKAKKKRKGTNPDQQYRNTAVASTAKKLARSQKEDVERAQALLSGQVPTDLIQIDDPKEYCICRYGVPNENSIMIQCEYKCSEWFHIECLGIKKHQTKSDVKWRCVGCKALYKEDSLGYFYWDSHAKITDYALTELIEEGRSLDVETQQLKKLQILTTKITKWKCSVKEILKRVCETNAEDLPTLQPQLYELYLHSLWLPSAHPESSILRKLVLMARSEV